MGANKLEESAIETCVSDAERGGMREVYYSYSFMYSIVMTNGGCPILHACNYVATCISESIPNLHHALLPK